MSPIPWTVNAEIYPTSVRANCISCSTSTNWLMNFIVSQTFLSMATAMSSYPDCANGHPNGVFFLYASVAVIGIFFVKFRMPETMGKTLEEISELFNSSPQGTLPPVLTGSDDQDEVESRTSSTSSSPLIKETESISECDMEKGGVINRRRSGDTDEVKSELLRGSSSTAAYGTSTKGLSTKVN